MDRPAQRRLLSFGALIALLGASPVGPTLRAARWTAPDRLVAVLTSEPAECLARSAAPAQAQRLAVGRAAFRSPLLLGGQAARLGLSCNACHRGGRDNPDFVFPGVSGTPGTADITTSILSSHRGDGVFNPKPIPDLSGPKAALRIDQDPASRRLPDFIRGLIVEEFDGPEPDPAVLDGLSTYVRSLAPGQCGTAVPITLSGDLARIDAALDAAIVAAQQGDMASARLLVAAARTDLSQIDERFQTNRARRATAGLRAAGAGLGTVETRFRTDPSGALARLQAWDERSESWRRPLRRAEARSLYNRAMLEQFRP